MKKIRASQQKPMASIMNIKSNEQLRSYLEQRPDLNLSLMRQKNQSTLLHYAAFKNQIAKLKIFMLHFEAFTKEHHKNNRHEASYENQLKAWINVANNQGYTALHFAALHGNIQTIAFLEKYGANMQALSGQRENVLFMCAQNNQIKAAIYLLEHREGKIPFDVNETNSIGNTILHKAAKHGYINFSAYLLSREDCDKQLKNNQGWTALMYAVAGSHKQIVKKMLLKGVNRNAVNQQQKRAIDLAGELKLPQMKRILQDEFTFWQRVKIACNYKVVYRVQKPTTRYCWLFIFLFHLLFLPTNILAEVDILGDQSFFLFYILIGIYYLLTMIIYWTCTNKHPSKRPQNLLQVKLPFCPQCRDSMRDDQFHCYISGKCIRRYDHYCPWINNCVSILNIGKFTSMLILLILGILQVLFISLTLYIQAAPQIKPSRFIDLNQQNRSKFYLINVIFSWIFGLVVILGLFSLLGDQLTNLSTNTTSYERAKPRKIKNKSLLTQKDQSLQASLNSLSQSRQVFEDQQEETPGCFTSCLAMLRQPYDVQQ